MYSKEEMFCKPFKCTEVDMMIVLDLDSEEWSRILFLPLSELRRH